MSKKVFRDTKTLRDSFKSFKEDFEESTVDYKTYANVIKSFNQRVMEKILFEAFEFEMPYRLGSLRIRKKKTHFKEKTMKIDWAKTRELGKRVYHMNEHTNYFNYRFYWKKQHATFINKKMYSFTATRDNKRLLASILKNNETGIDYYE